MLAIRSSLPARLITLLVTLTLASSVMADGDGGYTWNKVRYQGGTLETKVDPSDWSNKLTVTSDTISLELRDGQSLEIPTSGVTGLSYGQEAHRRVGTMAALGILVSPVALFGLFHKTRQHFVGVEYSSADGKRAGLLLQADKGNYRAILHAMKSATGANVAINEEDRKYVVGLADTGPAPEPSQSEAIQASSAQTIPSFVEANQTGRLTVESSPEEADVYVDGAFVGNAPAILNLASGTHQVCVQMKAHAEWCKSISIQSDSQLKLHAVLEAKVSTPRAE
jgi:hypothetical protein